MEGSRTSRGSATNWKTTQTNRAGPLSAVPVMYMYSIQFQTASISNINTRTVQQALHEKSFHGQAAAPKPKFTIHNAKRQLEWCKALEVQWKRVLWSDESRFTIWQSDGRIWTWQLPGECYLLYA